MNRLPTLSGWHGAQAATNPPSAAAQAATPGRAGLARHTASSFFQRPTGQSNQE